MAGTTHKPIAPGGTFLISQPLFKKKLAGIKAFIFDWDGVFNAGEKGENITGTFTESDAMGINLMRFGYHINHKNRMPYMAVVSGMNNASAEFFVRREYFNALYSNFKNKREPLQRICEQQGIKPAEVAYFFDDVLDIPIAEQCGIRIVIGKKTPVFNDYLKKNKLCDYMTANGAADYALREACEMLMQQYGIFEEVISKRVLFNGPYLEYLATRNTITPVLYHS